jgi:hypothetical protein
MGKIALKIVLSIVLGMALLKFGYMFKNDWLSIITQALGYLVVSYPFYLFFKLLVWKIKMDIKEYRINKSFYNQKGIVYGHITVDDKPLNIVKCIVKNADGSNNKWTHRWVVHTDKNGFYEVKYIPDGDYICIFSRTFTTGSTMVETLNFSIKNGSKENLNINIKK